VFSASADAVEKFLYDDFQAREFGEIILEAVDASAWSNRGHRNRTTLRPQAIVVSQPVTMAQLAVKKRDRCRREKILPRDPTHASFDDYGQHHER
jgi:hypothetical protein